MADVKYVFDPKTNTYHFNDPADVTPSVINQLYVHGTLGNANNVRIVDSNGTPMAPKVALPMHAMLTTGPGIYSDPAGIPLVDAIFSGKLDQSNLPPDPGLPAGQYSFGHLRKALRSSYKETFVRNQVRIDPNDNSGSTMPWLHRALVFTSQGYSLKDNSVFDFTVGQPILNGHYMILNENFDLEGGSTGINIGNVYLKPRIDPMGQGVTVPIEYKGNGLPLVNYTKNDYLAGQAKLSVIGDPTRLGSVMIVLRRQQAIDEYTRDVKTGPVTQRTVSDTAFGYTFTERQVFKDGSVIYRDLHGTQLIPSADNPNLVIRTDSAGNVFVMDGSGKTLFALPRQGFAVDGARQLIYRKPGGGIEIIAPANAIRGVDAGTNTLILDPARAARQSNGQPTNRITIGGSGFQRAAINGSSEQFAFVRPPPGSDQSQSGPGQSQSSSGPPLPSPPPRKPTPPSSGQPLPSIPLPKPARPLPSIPLPKPPVPDYALSPDFQGPPLPDSGPTLPDSGRNDRFLHNFDSGFLDLRIDNTLISTGPPPVAGNEVGLGVSLGGASVFVHEPTLNSGPLLGGSSFGAMEQANIIVGGVQPGAGIRTQASVTDSVRTLNDLFKPGISIRGPDYTRALGAGTSVVNQLNRARPIDPLVVDLDRDGVELLPRAPGGPAFDVDGDGALEVTGWVGADDGLVVIDRNGNGRIDDIREVVSDAMIPGSRDSREALASFDRNGDGRISAAEATAAEATAAGLLIWRDANSNGRTDSGELLSLSAAGITGFELTARPASVSRIAGNAVRGDLAVETADGVGTVAAIVDFAADSDGTTATTKDDLVVVTSQSGVVSVATLKAGGDTLALSDHGASIGHGGGGDDRITGSDGHDLLFGHGGRDVLIGGGGDDWLVIDADDDLAALDGGAGRDTVQIVGARGVTLSLSDKRLEGAVGGDGADIIDAGDVIAGQAVENFVISGGGGDDIILGGGADDVLTGDDGADYVHGAGGDDYIRGGRGNDGLQGGIGNDWLRGGRGNDRLWGGAGDDQLQGEQGNDVLDGGAGFDVVQLTGNRDDYRFERLPDGVWRVTDTVEGRDGIEFLRNIEAVNFADVGRVKLDDARPVPVADAIPLDGTGPVVIAAADLLANDIDFQGDALRIVAVENAVGGTAALRADGTILFTPDPDHVGLPAFSYRIEDAAGNRAVEVRFRRDSGDQIAELRGQVTLTPATLPTDERIADQWHLHAVNAPAVWPDYTGDGVTVGVFEVPESYQGTLPEFSRGSGFADFRHPDLAPNMDQALHGNRPQPENYSRHATEAAGVIGAARDGAGAVGVAYDVDLVSDEVPLGPTDKLQDFQHYDIANNSWGATEPFSDNFATNPVDVSAFEDAVTFGRGGLGTAIVFAAGNDRQDGARSDAKGRQSSRYAINVAAINAPGDLGALQPETQLFSEPGASLLVAAPGSDITTPSVRLESDEGQVFNDGFVATQGTSFAAPIVSGVIALMLEANPDLGYRDIQEILALSARLVDDPTTAWLPNGAAVWNGGGLSFSHDYGFGLVDAKAAVRLAETWTRQGTRANLHTVALSTGPLDRAIPDGGSLTETLTLDAGVSIEHVELRIDLEHEQAGDLVIRLVSPDGTRSVLLDREGRRPNDYGETAGSGRDVVSDAGGHDVLNAAATAPLGPVLYLAEQQFLLCVTQVTDMPAEPE